MATTATVTKTAAIAISNIALPSSVGQLYEEVAKNCGIWCADRRQPVAPRTALLNSSTSPVGTSDGRVDMFRSVWLTSI